MLIMPKNTGKMPCHNFPQSRMTLRRGHPKLPLAVRFPSSLCRQQHPAEKPPSKLRSTASLAENPPGVSQRRKGKDW